MMDERQINKAYDIAVWLEGLRRSSNAAFFPLYHDMHRYLVLKGGAGSGKSVFCARKVVERCVHEAGHRFMVVRKVKDSLRESCFDLLLKTISEHYPQLRIHKTEVPMAITLPNGSKIIFVGLNDVERLKSINEVSGVWIEEASELLEDDFSQIDLRLRGECVGGYFQIMLSFNPISAMHWLKKRFFDVYDADVLTHESNYKDNAFIDEQYKRTLESYRDKDPYYYMVYVLNQWGVTGQTVFDAGLVAKRLDEDRPLVRVGEFEYDYDGLEMRNIRWVDRDDGAIEIYVEVDKATPYVIGGDTAGEGSDKFVGQVIDNTNGVQVAMLRQTYDEDLYAKQMYCLGMYYNEALIGIETNYSTYPVRELGRLRYPKQYVREIFDNFDGSIRHSWGFNTNSKTRPELIAGLVKAFREQYNIINSEITLNEMLTFVRNPKRGMRPEAESGAHDDCVMALGIAHIIRGQQRMTREVLVEHGKKFEWTDDMWEDYMHADYITRERIIEAWGRPQLV